MNADYLKEQRSKFQEYLSQMHPKQNPYATQSRTQKQSN